MNSQNPHIHEQFLTLFTANEPAIRAYVRRLVPTRHDAADVMQAVSLVLWKKFPDLDQPDDFRKWSFGVARYEALAWLRDKARDRLVLAEDVLNFVANESLEDDDPLRRMELAQVVQGGCNRLCGRSIHAAQAFEIYSMHSCDSIGDRGIILALSV